MDGTRWTEGEFVRAHSADIQVSRAEKGVGGEKGGGVGGIAGRQHSEGEEGFLFDGFPVKENAGGQVTQLILQHSPLVAVFDGVGSPALPTAVWHVFAQPSMWTWGHTSMGGAAGAGHDAPAFWKCQEEVIETNSGVQALSSIVLSLAAQITGRQLYVQRLYGNGHTFGQGGSVHVDEQGAENYAAIYYANVEWQSNWLGHTHYLPGTATK